MSKVSSWIARTFGVPDTNKATTSVAASIVWAELRPKAAQALVDHPAIPSALVSAILSTIDNVAAGK